MKKTPKPTTTKALIERYYHCDVFDTDHFVLIGNHSLLKDWSSDVLNKDRQDEFVKMLKEPSGVNRGCMYPMAGGGSVVWLKPSEHLRYLVHELTHAASWLFKSKGIPICDQTDEVFCYLVECLFERLS